jgi:SAM-dependent methyltransferase
MSGFTDKEHLAMYAYNDAERLLARGAIYKFLTIHSIDLGMFPFRNGTAENMANKPIALPQTPFRSAQFANQIVGVVATFLDPNIGGAALDVGCGTGKYLPLLASQFERVVAADLSAGMLVAVPEGPWEKVVADVEAMEFEDDSFSLVLANHMLYHCPQIGSAVTELRRVLRPSTDGGTLIATTNGNGNMAKLYEMLASAASTVLGMDVDPLVPADSRFNLETGATALETCFESVSINRIQGALTVHDRAALDILRAYYRSSDDEWAARYGVAWPALEVALNAVLETEMSTNGEIRINTESGVLVAR